MKKDMMQKFFICLMILSLLVKEGYAEVTITPADGVKKDGDTLNFYMDENNHSFKEKTAIFIVNGATEDPTISFADSSKRFTFSTEKEGDSYVLYSTQSFDYEQNQRIYRMNVLVDADSYFNITTLNINNIDDEPPSLTSLQCTLDENTVYNLKNSPCSCILTDEDGWLSKTTFTISPETEAGLFDMGFKEIPDDLTYQADVFIYLKDDQQLDYETISFYMFNIIAKDSANHPTTPPEVLAIINVGDMRDTPPVWTKMIAFEQFEEQQEKTFTVSARDGDVGINKPIFYKVNSQDDEEEKYVTIDEKKGIIHVDPINRDKNDILMYTFEIAAYVSDEIEWSTSQSISFYIIDIDNNPPLVEYIIDPNMEKIVFDETTEKSTNLTFEENSTGGLNISIFMEDIDTGENAQFNVELEDIKDNKISYTEAFMIVPNIGYKNGDFEITILDSTKLDFEDENWRDIKFNVLAKGIHNESKQDRMSVNIALEDVNDEIPIFAEDEYSVTILETAKKDEYITTVLATDRDAEDKILKHTFVGSIHTSQILRIDSASGKIYVNSENAFDYDTINPVFVQVKATDAVGHYSTVPLTINLEDVNNKAPTISSGDPISVEENQKKGTKLISKISASDIDTTADLTVEIDWESSYALKNSRHLDMTDDTIRKQVKFLSLEDPDIGGRNIEINLLVNDATNAIPAPDFELFDSLYLTLKVTDKNTDKDFLDKKSTSAVILISIIDINDNVPTFQDITVDNRTVEENADANTTVGSIKAIDLDVTDTVTYSCYAEDPNFDWLDLDKNKGTFTVKDDGLIDPDTHLTFTFNYTCTASDNDMVHTSEEVTVPFYILDRNTKNPEITLDETISLIEKPDDGEVVAEIGTHDADRDIPFHTVVCQFPDAQDVCAKKFNIIDNILKVTKGALIDRDTAEPSFDCSIKCEDNQIHWRSEGVRSATKSFTILLIDKNDHTPELDTEDITTSESKAKGDSITEILATDIDEGSNAEIDFKLTSVINEETNEDITPLFDIKVEDDYVANITQKRAHLIANNDLIGRYGKYIINMVLSDKGEVPNVNPVNRTLTIKKYNFEEPYIIFPGEDSTFTLLSVQQEKSPLEIFRTMEHLEDFSASDGKNMKTCQKWDIRFSIRQLSPETETIFKMKQIANCIYQLQINDKFDSDEVLNVEKYKLEVKAEINKEGDDLWDDTADDAPYFSVRNITIKFADNAQTPHFINTTLPLEAQEGKQPQVLKLTNKAVYDNDDDDMPIHYFLVTEDKAIKNTFEVDESAGDITIVKKFYYDNNKKFEFQIVASNDSNPSNSKPNSYLHVTVTVLPANLRPPAFVSDYFFGAILPGFIVDTPIITAGAKDPDFVDQNTLQYWINDNKIDAIGAGLDSIPTPAFAVEKDTGRVILKFAVENTMSGYFSFDICVKDKDDQFGNKANTVCTKVTIFIITEDKTVDFRFYNNITELQDNEEQLLRVTTEVIEIQAYRQRFQEETTEEGLLTIARLYFINATISDVVRSAPVQAGSSVVAVDSQDIMSLVSQYGIYNKLQTEFRKYNLILVPFPASMTGESSQLKSWLIGISAVLGALCVVLLVIFIFKIRQLNKRISNLTSRKFGSQESGMNRLGISAPTTNKHAIEGSNPIFNAAEDTNMKKSKDNADFESISGDSDLIGVEDNPEFDYAFNETDDKTTYL